MSRHRQRRALPWAIVLLALVVCTVVASAGPGRSEGAAATPAELRPLATANLSNCSGTALPSNVSGTLAVVGTAAPSPSVVGVPFEYVFDYLSIVGVQGQPPVATCGVGNATFATGAGGAFHFPVPLPTGGCTGTTCTEYSGPYSTPYFVAQQPDPPGYFFRWNATWPNATLGYVAVLESLAIDPAGPLTVSVDAPTTLVAVARAGNGNVTPANATVTWDVSTAGWSVTPSGGPGSVQLLAAPGATPATLNVEAAGTYNGTPVAAWSNLSLDAVPTGLTSASLSATRIDVGEPFAVVANGTGAAGYSYTGWVTPGLGEASIPVPCRATAGPGGLAAIACAGNASYAADGDAVPTMTLTNGFSQATLSLPAVTIDDAPFLAVTPFSVAGYVNRSIPITLSVAPGSGTPPFGPACLDGTGLGVHCTSSPGPSWAFVLQYSTPGERSVNATVLDSVGENASTQFSVDVAAPPSLVPMTASAEVVEAGTSIGLTSVYSGGVLPAAYWWNLSSPGGTSSTGVLRADGAVPWSYVPEVPGAETVTLTIVDALGSRVASSTSFTVLPGPATAVEASSWNDSVIAGSPSTWSWFATDPGGQRVGSFASPLSLAISGPGPSAFWVNASSLNAPLPEVNGTIDVPLEAWLGGYLNLTVTVDRAGPYVLQATGLAPPLAFAPGDRITLTCAPDLAHVHLVHPEVELAGDRINNTLWRISDAYGNALSGGDVVVTQTFDEITTSHTAPIVPGANVSTVWVNYSAPGLDGGTVTVRTSWGVALLPPISVPSAETGAIAEVNPLAWGGLGLVGLAGAAVWLVRRRTPEAAATTAIASDDELRRYAEGRERLLERIQVEGPVTLDDLQRGSGPDGPTRGELGEWIASLLTERLIQSRFVDAGTLEYFARREERPRIEFDESVLARPSDPEDPAHL